MSTDSSTAAIVDPDSEHYQTHIRPALERIEGWLAEPAAQFTSWVMAQQNHQAIAGGILELGVYRGRYLALLYLCGQALKRPVVGVDLFSGEDSEHNPYTIAALKDMLRTTALKSQLRSTIKDVSGETEQLHILAADTLKLKTSDLAPLLGPAGAAFISIDGGHEAIHLVNDIELGAKLLAPGGIIAVDDAFNHSTPGAIEGTCRWFDTHNEGRLAAFAQCYNKLFICRTADHASWLAQAKEYVHSHSHLDFAQRTLQRMHENDAIGFSPRFFDQEIVPFL